MYDGTLRSTTTQILAGLTADVCLLAIQLVDEHSKIARWTARDNLNTLHEQHRGESEHEEERGPMRNVERLWNADGRGCSEPLGISRSAAPRGAAPARGSIPARRLQ